mgnify:CR=1 FL=1
MDVCQAVSAYVERMVKEAEAHAEEDKQRREETEARNNAENLVYSTEKFLADSGEQVPADVSGAVIFALSDLSRFVTGQLLPVNGGFVMN